uniref:Swt1-like HEPN domain-containing protein n=1 Tax=Ignavibacterium album TaxID=591197 RepID=A0A7V2ZKG9_9BACT
MKPIDVLINIFSSQITVKNIAKPTIVYGSKEEAKRICIENNYDVSIFRNKEEEEILVYLKSNDDISTLKESQIISDSTPISEVLDIMIEPGYAFIKEHRKISHIVTRADFDSIPVRIWLFGMISLFEYEMRDFIRKNIKNWENDLTKIRVQKAKNLFNEKKKRNEEVDLLDCTQLTDIGKILIKNKHICNKKFSHFSNQKLSSFFNSLNKLRDELAHSQRITIDLRKIKSLLNFIETNLQDNPSSI